MAVSSSAEEFSQVFQGQWQKPLTLFACLLALAHLYFALFADISETLRNIIHFSGFALLCATTYPIIKDKHITLFDLAFGLLVAGAALYLGFAEDAIYARGVKLSTLDWIAAIIVIVGAIELSRRAAGFVIPLLIILALSYIALWGQYINGVFRFPGLSLETILFRSIYGDDAIFGSIARISSTYVFLFIIFGAFLLRSGAGDFVINLAHAVAGKFIGGPGLVAVIASGLTGTISGSAVANTASTGVITIPLMKRAGFSPPFAAGVEAASSTGGQLMPPIMGAGAFVMASYTQIPYEMIVQAAALPALLYFASVAMFVRIEAKRQNLQPFTGDAPTLKQAFKKGGPSFVIPISVVVFMLVSGFTPEYAAVVGIISVIAASWLTPNPMGPKAVYEALALGSKNMIMTAVLLCAVGLIVNVIATAGVGNTFSLMISGWADGNILLAIALIALASLVLGMGLPVTAAYIVLATLSAPALAAMISDGFVAMQIAAGTLPDTAKPILMLASPEAAMALGSEMSYDAARSLLNGLPPEITATLRDLVLAPETLTLALLSAHMIIFWLSQDSNVTPPVALAAFTGAAIAKAPPMATGFQSWKLAKGLYIVPLLFAYTPFLSGNWSDAIPIFLFALVGIYAIAAAMQGWMENRLNIALRLASFLAGLACLWPNQLLINIAGAGVVIALLVFNLKLTPQHPKNLTTN